MTKNPIINALCAVLYIAVVVLFMSNAERWFPSGEETIVMPMAFLSLFVLSAATMGYLFLYEPLQMFFDGKRKEATDLFLKTLLTFGVATIALIIIGIFFSAYLPIVNF